MALDLTPRRFLFLDVAMKYGPWVGDTRPTQLYDAINFSKLEFAPPPQKTSRITSRMEGSIGQALASVQRPTGEPGTLDAEFDAAPVGFLALALGATVVELAVSAAPVADAAVTTVLGLWVKLPNAWIDAATFVLETDGDPDVAIDATKYQLDAVNGFVKATHADAVGSKLASYSVKATTGETYHAGQALSTDVYLVGTGTEQATKKRCSIVVERANLAPGGKFDPVAGDALKGSVKGDLLTPADAVSPWRYAYSNWASTL
ncbi:hypothetical protein [Candidatus Thiodictyon syntrophicum]|jgi:hypothetical protein|uniref:Uncharacterized protein n=1 Tax=Candidatus Thiodictyon syntrophicum TaxID=1166950 RepID=A0A2K8U7A0_9GAMM|nr:hypothetical protein [Candidatus Thiodictyon syntrophicum]AUB81453.1 hypothetical protein THSYN_11140 [Candidatus Thiodictyon syntrophicum]